MIWTPNRRKRPQGETVRLILLHSTIGSFKGAVSWLMNPASGVSSHFVVSKAGTVRKLAPMSDYTFHAGRSEWKGKKNVNYFSLGVEMEHFDRPGEVWPQVQIEAVAGICRELVKVYGWLPIVGHRDICIPKGRKSDPRDFPYQKLIPLIAAKGLSH